MVHSICAAPFGVSVARKDEHRSVDADVRPSSRKLVGLLPVRAAASATVIVVEKYRSSILRLPWLISASAPAI